MNEMTSIEENIKFLKEEWSQPKKASYDNESHSFELTCMFNEASPESNIISIFKLMSIKELPVEYKEFLLISNGAFLFLDEKYGQAGLNLYSLEERETKISFWLSSYRVDNLIKGDLIIGEFLGDSDFVVLRCDEEADDYGTIIISHPYDERKNWFYEKDGFAKFLSNFVRTEGCKYWELI